MEGKLCVTKVDNEYVEGVFVAPKREEYVRIKREMINMPITPGNVLRVDYSWTAVSVFEVLGDKFFNVEATVKEIVNVNHIQIAESQEEADKIFKDRLGKNYHRLKAAIDEDGIKSVGVKVE